MRIIFLGSNTIAEKSISEINKLDDIEIIKIITPNNQHAGRMEKLAQGSGIEINTINNKRELRELISEAEAELIVVCNFPIIIPKEIISKFPQRIINLHASPLPKYRGAHPVNWALVRDEKVFGMTVHFIDGGIDTGDILTQESFHINNTDNIESISEQLISIGPKLLAKSIKQIQNNEQEITKQEKGEFFYARKRTPDDSKIDWKKNSRDIFNLIRASVSPYSAFCFSESDEKIEVTNSKIFAEKGIVLGEFEDRYLISTGDGVILIETDKKLRIGEKLQ